MQTLTIAAGEGINTVASNQTITISGEDASSSNKGIATFDATDFTVTSGNVVVKTTTLGTSALNPGETTTSLSGLQSLSVDNINVDGNTISSTNTNGDIVLDPNGSGNINASSARIMNIAEPIADSDAASKYYVDAARSGLDIKQSVKVATTGNITLSGTQVIDGYSLVVGNRVLVKNQTTATQNGIYDVQSGAWTRSSDADNIGTNEVNSGMFCFVEEGTSNSNSGFVLTTSDPITLGTSSLDFSLFSASGTLIAGDGLSKDGYTLKVNTDTVGGLEIVSDNLKLKSTVAGDGLSYSNGVVTVGGTTNRISTTTTTVDIASTYVGQTSITTLGTVATGTWSATTIAVNKGGTGQTSLLARGIVFGNGTSAVGTTGASTINGSFLREDSTGNPYWSNVIDCGTY